MRTGAPLPQPNAGVLAQCPCHGAHVCRAPTLRFSTGSGACSVPLGKLLLDTALATAAREEAENHDTEPPRYWGSSLPGASSAPWVKLTTWHRAASVLSVEGQPVQSVLTPCVVGTNQLCPQDGLHRNRMAAQPARCYFCLSCWLSDPGTVGCYGDLQKH